MADADSPPSDDLPIEALSAPNPNKDRLDKDGAELEFLKNVQSTWTVPEEKSGERVRFDGGDGEIYLSSQTYEALDGSTDATTRGGDDDYFKNLKFMDDFISYLSEKHLLEQVMGGAQIRFGEDAQGALAAFVDRQPRVRNRRRGAQYRRPS